jgi:hypothetical protein
MEIVGNCRTDPGLETEYLCSPDTLVQRGIVTRPLEFVVPVKEIGQVGPAASDLTLNADKGSVTEISVMVTSWFATGSPLFVSVKLIAASVVAGTSRFGDEVLSKGIYVSVMLVASLFGVSATG